MSRFPNATIVEFEPSLWPEVDGFWTGILGRSWNATARRRWNWLNARRTHYLAMVDGRIGGNATLLRQEFVSGDGAPMNVGWITDFYVRPHMKGRGLGKQLTLRLMEAVPYLVSFGQSEDARQCFSRLGWTEPRWIPMVGHTLPQIVGSRAPSIRIEESSFEDPAVDAVWGARGLDRPAGLRSARALSSRFTGRPDASYRIFLARGPDGPLGWVVTRLIREIWNRRFGPVPTGLIVDVLAIEDREDVLAALIDFARRDLGRHGALVVLAVESAGNVRPALQQAAFRNRMTCFGFDLRQLPAKGFVASPGAAPVVGNLPFLSFLDCDAELTF